MPSWAIHWVDFHLLIFGVLFNRPRVSRAGWWIWRAGRGAGADELLTVGHAESRS